MAIDNFYLRVAIKEIEGQQSDMALRWVMLKMWLDKQEAAQPPIVLTCPACQSERQVLLRCPKCGSIDAHS